MKTTIRRVQQTRNGICVETMNNKYCFPWVTGDRIRGGTKEDIEGAVTYGGDSLSKYYIRSHDMDGIPNVVLQAVDEHATILDDVDGGWANWDGRPEWSDSYVDISDATIVDV